MVMKLRFTQKVKDFYDRLTALRRMARSVPAEQLLEEIFVSTGYLAALGVMENGAHRREDARRFASFCARPVQTASRRWCVPSTRRRWQVPPGRILCPAVRGLAV